LQKTHKEQMRITKRIHLCVRHYFLCDSAEGDALESFVGNPLPGRGAAGAWRKARQRAGGLLKFHYASPVPMQQGISREW
jgi:hypothetical protein